MKFCVVLCNRTQTFQKRIFSWGSSTCFLKEEMSLCVPFKLNLTKESDSCKNCIFYWLWKSLILKFTWWPEIFKCDKCAKQLRKQEESIRISQHCICVSLWLSIERNWVCTPLCLLSFTLYEVSFFFIPYFKLSENNKRQLHLTELCTPREEEDTHLWFLSADTSFSLDVAEEQFEISEVFIVFPIESARFCFPGTKCVSDLLVNKSPQILPQ